MGVRLRPGVGEMSEEMTGPTAAFPCGDKPKPALSKPRELWSPAGESFLSPVPPRQVVPAVADPEEPITVAHIVVETAALTTDISHTPDIVGKPARSPSVCPCVALSTAVCG